jgi:large subunit ribosomal protein L22
MGISYSVEADPDTTAKAMLRERPISLKHSKAIAREIKGRSVADAEAYLNRVIDGEQSVPFREHNAGAGHRSDIDGWDAGRYPEKAATDFLKLLENGRNNATEQGFDGAEMVIDHVAPHKVGERQGRKSRAFGRASPWNTTLCDVELILAEPDAAGEAGEAGAGEGVD